MKILPKALEGRIRNMANQVNKSIVISDTAEFQRLIDVLNSSLNRINNCFETEKKEMENYNNPNIWAGFVQKKTYEKYQSLNKCNEAVSESMGIYVKFLHNTLDQYVKLGTSLDNSIDVNDVNLDVN